MPTTYCWVLLRFFRASFVYKEIVTKYRPDTLKPRVCTYLLDQHVQPTMWGKSPILTRKEIARANADTVEKGGDGLFAYYFTWQEEQILREPHGPHIFSNVLTDAIKDIYKGYWLEGTMAEIFSLIARAHMPGLGFHVHGHEEYYKTTEIPQDQQLFLAYVDRKNIMLGSVLYYLVTVHSPKLKLTRKQREILEFIWQGATDSMLAQHYEHEPNKKGLASIRSRISLIYKHVFSSVSSDSTLDASDSTPAYSDSILPADASDSISLMDSNARLMRVRLIDYLKDHYEEFRPYPATRSISRDQDGKFLGKVITKEN